MLGKGEREAEGLNCKSRLGHCKTLAFTLSEKGGHCRGLPGFDFHFKMIRLGAVLRMDYRGWQTGSSQTK